MEKLINANKLHPDNMLQSVIMAKPVQAIVIPDNATNGDMVKAMFPYGEYGTNGNEVHVFGVGGNGVLVFTLEWWNAPYKKNCIPSEYDYTEDIELTNPQIYR